MDNKELEKKLSYEKKSAWTDEAKIKEYAEEYKVFLKNKTERQCVSAAAALAQEHGYKDLSEVLKDGTGLKYKDKVYSVFQNKCIVLMNIGSIPLENGMNITAAHLDSPRLDLKAVPLYEDSNIAYFKTHYYGGIKKYQWASVPLSLHGVVYTTEGEKIEISVGDNESDPVFFISDLLIHLAADQMQKKASNVISGEQLNIIIGSIPADDSEVSKKIKFGVLKLLNEKYGIDEESLLTAELEIVPEGEARDVGFDRSMISAYGHDDRVCSYAALTALTEAAVSGRTAVCILCDKEEIGSTGSTGLQSRFFENIIAEVYSLCDEGYSDLKLRRALSNSYVLSMDVNAGYDPAFSEVFEKANTALLGDGAVLTKYTGRGGKSGSNDANSEYIYRISRLFSDNEIIYQTGELGKVDQGGGGTVAYILASYGAQTIDFGVPVLSMHAPFELISKADLYASYQGAKVFYESNFNVE